MKFDYSAFDELFSSKFYGNYHEAARQLGLDPAHIHRAINKKKGVGLFFVSALMRWCKENNKEFIFLN